MKHSKACSARQHKILRKRYFSGRWISCNWGYRKYRDIEWIFFQWSIKTQNSRIPSYNSIGWSYFSSYFKSYIEISKPSKCFCEQTLNFSKVPVGEIIKEIKASGTRKAIQRTDSPIKIIKKNANIDYICLLFNKCIGLGTCASISKQAHILPVFKTRTWFLNKFLSKFQYGFRKKYRARNCLMTI